MTNINKKDDLLKFVLPDTSWAKENTSLYVIKDKGRIFCKIRIDGKVIEEIFSASEKISGIKISPNGNLAAISVNKEVFIIDLISKKAELVDVINKSEDNIGIAKVEEKKMRLVSWSPDSTRIIYERSWFDFNIIHEYKNQFLFDYFTKNKIPLNNPYEFCNIYWDKEGKAIYYKCWEKGLNKIYRLSPGADLILESEAKAKIIGDNILKDICRFIYRMIFRRKSAVSVSNSGEKIWIEKIRRKTDILYENSDKVRCMLIRWPGDLYGNVHWLAGSEYALFVVTGGRGFYMYPSTWENFVLHPSTKKIGRLVEGRIVGVCR